MKKRNTLLLMVFVLVPFLSYCQISTSFEDGDGWSNHSSGNWTESTPEGTYTGSGMYANGGSTNTGSRKIGFNDVGDSFELPPIDYPLIFTYEARLSSNASGTNELTIEKNTGSGWVIVIVHTATTNSYSSFLADINEPTATGVRIRMRRTADNRSHYVDDLNVTVDSPAPVSLSAFSAEAQEDAVALIWTTASEENSDYFSIEHSTDGINYTEIDYVKGAGTSFLENNYEYFHRNPAKGANYYRLAQVDYNRSINYSAVEVVEMLGEDLFSAYPTLAKGEITLNFSEAVKQDATIEVFDLMGRLVIATQMEDQAINQNLDISQLQNGHYLVRLQSANEAHAVRFIKY